MANRTVKVEVTAGVSGYLAAFKQVQDETDKASSSAQKFAKQSQAMTQVGVAAGAAGALIGVGVGLAISKFAEFDQEMSNVQAATHETAGNMELLRNAAVQAGADTVFSATEAAQAVEELAKAGVSTASILSGGLAGALSLASAGGIAVADAAQIAATALTQFKLEGSDVPHVADLLAAGAGKAQGSVEDLSQALNQGGLVSSQAGQSIEETTGTLAAFASAGLIGSDAGTSLKTMLLSLESPSTKAANVMSQYGINIYDSNGKMLDFVGIADQLKGHLSDLTQEQRNSALATIFGTDAVRSASVLYDQGGSGIKAWTDKVNDSGYAAETARLKLDNLNGDLEYLSGSVDTALIQSGSAANDVLRGLVQTATNLVNAFDGAPQVVQSAALGIGAVAAAALLAGGAFLVGVPQVAAFTAALDTLSASEIPAVVKATGILTTGISGAGTVMRATAGFLTSGWGVAFVAGAAAVALLSKAVDDGKTSVDVYQAALKTGNIDTITNAATKQWVVSRAVFGDYSDQLKNIGPLLDKAAAGNSNFLNNFSLSTQDFDALQALRDMGTQLGTLAGTDLPGAEMAFVEYAKANRLSNDQQITLLNTMGGPFKDALTTQATKTNQATTDQNLLSIAQAGGVTVTKTAAQAYTDAAGEASSLNDAVMTLLGSVNAANKTGQDAVSANADYQKALQGVKDTLADIDPATGNARTGTDALNKTLDQGTAAGSANVAMLSDLAKSGQASAAAQLALDGNTQSYQTTLQSVHDQIYQQAKAFGATDDAAAALADQVAAMPTAYELKAIAQTSEASKALDDLRAQIDALPSSRSIQINTDNIVTYSDARDTANGGKANGGTIGFAGGGTAFGPGTAKSDSILTRLSTGEEVIQNPYASMFRTQLKQMNQGVVPSFSQKSNYMASAYSGGSAAQAAPVTITQNFADSGVTGPMAMQYAERERNQAMRRANA